MNENENCIFCKIANKIIPSYIIYEDKDFLGFLDILPLKKYHTLLIPKKHFNDFNDMDEELLKKSIKIRNFIFIFNFLHN